MAQEKNHESEAGYGGSKGSDGQKADFGVRKSKIDGIADLGGKDAKQYKDVEDQKKQAGV